tara:strand:- start:2916 stop:3479 length:564 start_codon:yes stop_codon:yes gene_type:complete
MSKKKLEWKEAGKNLQQVKDMVDGTYGRKIVVGEHSIKSTDHRKVGEKWTDSDGVEWEQKEGYRMKLSKTPPVGIFTKQCKDCKKSCAYNKRDKKSYTKLGRCYYCQIDFEALLKSKPIGTQGLTKWHFWVHKDAWQRWDAAMEETDIWAKEMLEGDKKLFDESVVNAMANSNVDTTMKINKKMTGV